VSGSTLLNCLKFQYGWQSCTSQCSTYTQCISAISAFDPTAVPYGFPSSSSSSGSSSNSSSSNWWETSSGGSSYYNPNSGSSYDTWTQPPPLTSADCTKLDGEWIVPSVDKASCLKTKRCCDDLNADGTCASELNFHTSENAANCTANCGSGTGMAPAFEWLNPGVWGKGNWVKWQVWKPNTWKAKTNWINVIDITGLVNAVDSALSSVTGSVESSYVSCKHNALSQSISDVSCYCGFNNTACLAASAESGAADKAVPLAESPLIPGLPASISSSEMSVDIPGNAIQTTTSTSTAASSRQLQSKKPMAKKAPQMKFSLAKRSSGSVAGANRLVKKGRMLSDKTLRALQTNTDVNKDWTCWVQVQNAADYLVGQIAGDFVTLSVSNGQVTSNPKACVNLGAMAVNKAILPTYDFASVDATTNKIVPLGLSGLTVDTTVTPNQLCGNIPVGQEVVPILRINAWSSSTSNVDNTCQANKNAMAAIIAQQIATGRLPAGASYTPPTGATTQVAFNAAANSAASNAAAAAVTQANTAAVSTSTAGKEIAKCLLLWCISSPLLHTNLRIF